MNKLAIKNTRRGSSTRRLRSAKCSGIQFLNTPVHSATRILRRSRPTARRAPRRRSMGRWPGAAGSAGTRIGRRPPCELRRGQVLYDRNYDNYDECALRYRNYDTVKAVGALRPTPLPLRTYYLLLLFLLIRSLHDDASCLVRLPDHAVELHVDHVHLRVLLDGAPLVVRGVLGGVA